MNQSLTRIYFYTALSVFLTSPFLLSQTKLFAKQEAAFINEKSNLDDSRNRFPEILHDVKILLSEVLIADHHLDTLEVIYNLSRIYDLLMEADQIGDMNQEDLVPGAIIEFTQDNGQTLPGIIGAVNEHEASVDFNHPLAGEVLLFEVEVVEVKS